MENNNINQSPLTKKQIKDIRHHDRIIKLLRRIEYGFYSLGMNFIKSFIAVSFIVIGLFIWFGREVFIEYLYPEYTGVSLELLTFGFTYALPVTWLLLFVFLLLIFGIRLCARGWEIAFIDLGIYHGHTCPWLLEKRKVGVYWVYKILLNGATKEEFESKRNNLQSRMHVRIHEFEEIGVDKLLIYTTSNRKQAKSKQVTDRNY